MTTTTTPTGFTWESAREELKRRRARAHELGGPDAVARQRKAGRMTIRERLALLADSESFVEIGKLATSRRFDADGNELDPTSAGYVMGLAKVEGRPVAIGGEDFTVNGGQSAGLDRSKGGLGGFVEDLAHEYRIPLLLTVEGAGGGVGSQMSKGHAPLVSSVNFFRSYQLLSEVPVLAAAVGPCAGAAAGRVVLAHFSVMARDTGCLFAGGPPVVRRSLGRPIDKFALGGAEIHGKVSGMVDNVAETQEEAIAQLRRVLTYLPQNVWEMPPFVATDDPVDRRDEQLLKIVPENRRRPYDMHKIVEVIVDQGSWFEIGHEWGRSLVTGLARIGGHPAGIIASNPMHIGGAFDSQAATKQARFIEFMDTFHLPIVYFVDTPGFMIGEAAERDAVVRKGMRALQAMMEMTVPMVTVHVRKAYGLACNSTANPDRLHLRVAWPTAEWGDMPIEGGVEAGFRRQIEAAPDPEAYRAEIEARLMAESSPWKTAEAFGVEEMIDPTETREFLFKFIEASQGAIRSNLGVKYRAGIRI